MTTVKKIEKVSDKERIAQLERERLEYLPNLFTDYEAVINESINYIPSSISTWFRAYVLSPEFQELDRNLQLKVFEQKEHLEYVLEEIDRFMLENKLGGYNV